VTPQVELVPGSVRKVCQLTGEWDRQRNSFAHNTAQSHAGSHNVTIETARQDLVGLERMKLMHKARIGKANVWYPIDDLAGALRDL
jgi:hypothetical protein